MSLVAASAMFRYSGRTGGTTATIPETYSTFRSLDGDCAFLPKTARRILR